MGFAVTSDAAAKATNREEKEGISERMTGRGWKRGTAQHVR